VENLWKADGNCCGYQERGYDKYMTKETILIVDDDPEILKILRDYLEKENYIVITANNGTVALQRIHSERPDCVVLDVMLPDQDGWAITRTVRADDRVSKTPIILLTARVDDTDKIIGLEMGADDYVTKPFNPREIIARIRVQLRHSQQTTSPQTQLKIGAVKLDIERHLVHLYEDVIDLTATEFEILRTFMQHAGYTFTRDELVEKALGYSFAGLGRTIDSHVKNIRQKIEPDPRNPIYLLTVYGVGYRFAEEIS
jgi:two-component system, OmpR family, alkaline phosphatase synthesis response regulator PhoP